MNYSSVTVKADDSDVIQTMCVANAQLSYRPSLGISQVKNLYHCENDHITDLFSYKAFH